MRKSLRRHWGYRTLGKRTYSLEEFVPVRVDCRLPRNAKFDYAAVSLRAGDDAFAGVTEVRSIVLMEGVAEVKRIDLLMLFLKGLGSGSGANPGIWAAAKTLQRPM